jgi:hypothetical protein
VDSLCHWPPHRLDTDHLDIALCHAIKFVPLQRIVDETIRANVEITTTISGSAKCFCRRCSPFSLRSKISGIVKDSRKTTDGWIFAAAGPPATRVDKWHGDT